MVDDRKAGQMTGARPDTWMPFYVGDYLRDTMDLNATENGVYFLLIGHYWMNGGPLPDDLPRLAIACRLLDGNESIASYILGRFFENKDGKWHHKRIDQELSKAKRITRERKKAGKIGGLASGIVRSNREANTEANAKQTAEQKATPSPSPSKKEESPPLNARASQTAVPKDFKPDAETEQFVALKCIQASETEAQIELFVNHYRANGETRADWQATFRKWMVRRGRFEPTNGVGRQNQSTAPPSFSKAAMEVLKRAKGDDG